MNKGAVEKPYMVLVDDNFDYMDEDKRYRAGEYDSLEEAVAACRTIVDAFLQKAYEPGMTAAELYHHYVSGGDDPFVLGPGAAFSAWDYAKQRCEILCGGPLDRKGA